MKCENCPAGWEERSYEGECQDCGCLIMGHDLFFDDCWISISEAQKRIRQLKDYESGKIERPQWVANRFMRELDDCCAFSGGPSIQLPAYPPARMNNGFYFSIYGAGDLYNERCAAYKQGYEDAKAGKGCDAHGHYGRFREREEVLFE